MEREPPLQFNLAQLLRIPFQVLVRELHERLAVAGYADIRPTHTIMFALVGLEDGLARAAPHAHGAAAAGASWRLGCPVADAGSSSHRDSRKITRIRDCGLNQKPAPMFWSGLR